VLSTGILIVHGLLQILAALHVVIAGLEERIEALVKVHPDFFIVDSLPGAGPVMGPRLIAVLGNIFPFSFSHCGPFRTSKTLFPRRPYSRVWLPDDI